MLALLNMQLRGVVAYSWGAQGALARDGRQQVVHIRLAACPKHKLRQPGRAGGPQCSEALNVAMANPLPSFILSLNVCFFCL